VDYCLETVSFRGEPPPPCPQRKERSFVEGETPDGRTKAVHLG